MLVNEAETELFQILQGIADDNVFSISQINGEADHVHLLMTYTPQHYIPDMLKALKGVSA